MRYLTTIICLSAALVAFDCEAKFNVDLDVTHVSRTPLYPSYHRCVEYDEGGFNPHLNDEGKKITKTQPDEGETVTYTAHIINKGRKSSKPCSYIWKIGGEKVATGTIKPVKRGNETTVSIEWKWKSERTAIEFILDPDSKSGDEFWTNNKRLIYSDAWQLFMYVHKKVYEKADSTKSFFGNYSFEDFIQHHIDDMNQKFADSKSPLAPDGCHARVVIDRFFVYGKDKELTQLMNDPDGAVVRHLYDGIWGFPWKEAEKGKKQRNYADIFDKRMDWGLLHELGHQLGLIDYYNSDLYPCNNYVTGDDGYPVRIGHTAGVQGMMRTHGDVLFSDLSAAALNAQIGKRRGFYGDYLLVTPEKNYIRVLDNMGKPIPGAILRFYQYENSIVPDNVVFAGYTDKNGLYLMPNRSAKSITTPNGFTQKPNPFGKIQVDGYNSLMFFSITARGYTEYRWLDLSMLNRAWFGGNKEKATFTYRTSIGTEGAPKPPLLTGDFISPEELLLRWHKYPRMWVDAFKLYSRQVDIGRFPYGVDTVDSQPFEVSIEMQQKDGKWDHNVKLDKAYQEFYLTSVGDFKRESNPSEIVIVPSVDYRGKPVTVTVDDDANIVYAADGLPGVSNNWRIGNRGNFTSVFLSPPERKYGGISDIVFDRDGFIATCPSNNCVFFYDKFGNGLLSLGKEGSAPGEFKEPTGIAVHGTNIYVCDTGNDRVQVFTFGGEFVKEFGESGSGPGQFESPSGIALASDGTMAVSDSGNNRVQLFKRNGEFIRELTGLNNPRGIDCYADRFYIADTDNNRVLKTDKELAIIQVIEKVWGENLKRPMDVWVHHYPAQRSRKAFATLFIADYGSHLIKEERIPKKEIEHRPSKRQKDIKRAVAYGRFFDLDDPDTAFKPLQIALFGLVDNVFSTREWTMRLDNVPTGLLINEPEVSFIVNEYFQAFVDYKVAIPKVEVRIPNADNEDYALTSKGSRCEGFIRAELAIDGNTKEYDGTNGYAYGIWKKLKPDTLTITLEEAVTISNINVLLWDKDNRYYDYRLEVSGDGETWIELPIKSPPNVVRDITATLKKFKPNDEKDNSAHIVLDYKLGYRGWTAHNLGAMEKIKYIRVTGKYNSANSGFQIVEIQAWGPKGQ